MINLTWKLAKYIVVNDYTHALLISFASGVSFPTTLIVLKLFNYSYGIKFYNILY